MGSDLSAPLKGIHENRDAVSSLSSCGRGPVGFPWRPRRAEAPGLVLPLTAVILSLSVSSSGWGSFHLITGQLRVERPDVSGCALTGRVWLCRGRDWASAAGSDERLWAPAAVCPPWLTPVPGGLSGGDSSRGRGWRNGSRRWSVWSKLLIGRCAL